MAVLPFLSVHHPQHIFFYILYFPIGQAMNFGRCLSYHHRQLLPNGRFSHNSLYRVCVMRTRFWNHTYTHPPHKLHLNSALALTALFPFFLLVSIRYTTCSFRMLTIFALNIYYYNNYHSILYFTSSAPGFFIVTRPVMLLKLQSL